MDLLDIRLCKWFDLWGLAPPSTLFDTRNHIGDIMVGVLISSVVDHWWYNGWHAHLQCGRSLVV